MTTYLHDGTVFDLGIPHADVFGTHWTWTGIHNGAREAVVREQKAHQHTRLHGGSRPVGRCP
ncbi:phiSA1p31-related protein [Streptomyces reniochalinae]